MARAGGLGQPRGDHGSAADHGWVHRPERFENPVGVWLAVLPGVLPPGHAGRQVGSVAQERPFALHWGVLRDGNLADWTGPLTCPREISEDQRALRRPGQ